MRGGRGIWRPRNPPRRDDNADWEHRKSRSPAGRVPHKDMGSSSGVEPSGDGNRSQCAAGGDLGAALMSGALPMAEGAPLPLGFHPDPMMEFYNSLCVDGLPEQHVHRDCT
jgi:hypothetical protein